MALAAKQNIKINLKYQDDTVYDQMFNIPSDAGCLTCDLLPLDGGLCGESTRNAHDPLLLLQRTIQLCEIYLLCIHRLWHKLPTEMPQ